MLVLKDYTLDAGHLGGLSKVLNSGQVTLNAALFDNCGIDDEELAIMLEAFTQQHRFEHFVYKNNVFKEEGLDAM